MSKNNVNSKIIPVILCGGAGSRLWPLSREQHPKPFIKLMDGESLLQKTFQRITGLENVEHVITITNRELLFKVEDEYSEYNCQNLFQSYILEPVGRNTAPAILTAALHVNEMYGENTTILVLPADHLIQDEKAFQEAVSKAFDLSRQNQFVTFGIEPTYPETGFGYIESESGQVKRFVEKPCFEKALDYLQQGNFYWNSGMFCFPVKELLTQMQECALDIYEKTLISYKESKQLKGENCIQVELPKSFAGVPDNSIDYSLMEPLSSKGLISVVPCNLGWSDIGSWNSLGELIEQDENNNRIIGDVLVENSTNIDVHGGDRIIGAVGLKDLIVVDTSDALLIANKANAQDVKTIYSRLKTKAHDAYKLHRTVYRPWGTYTVLEEGTGFKIKRIEVKPEASLSLQMHYHRSEHWIVVSGMAQVVNGEKEFFIQTNESTFISAGSKHRLHNPGKLPLVMIEVQSGDYLGEDDIVRFEDVYGRA
jgi:mannose-1-phosphate guanylyltransferase